MPNMGFTIVDYSTKRRILDPRLEVVVPKSTGNTLRDRRMFFRIARNLSGDLIAFDTPPGNYEIVYASPGYVTKKETVASPMLSPHEVELHRSSTYPFTQEDTLLIGEIQSSVPNLEPEQVTVQLFDLSPSVPNHLVPVYRVKDVWQYVLYVPEKKEPTVPVTLAIAWPLGTKLQPINSLTLSRTNQIQPIPIP